MPARRRTPGASASSDACVAYASETNGPYSADDTNTSRGTTSTVLTVSGVERSDVRSSSIGTATPVAGVLLTLEIALQDVNNGCASLEGWAIHVWDCDANGLYSVGFAT